MGVSYYNGLGVPQNTRTAVKWLKRAIAQGGHGGRLAQHKLDIIEYG
ncbi:MAG: SEL1-like repeat protein [Acidithiobacillus sp.]